MNRLPSRVRFVAGEAVPRERTADLDRMVRPCLDRLTPEEWSAAASALLDGASRGVRCCAGWLVASCDPEFSATWSRLAAITKLLRLPANRSAAAPLAEAFRIRHGGSSPMIRVTRAAWDKLGG